MITFYGPPVAEVNEKSPQESSLDLALIQHPYNENPEPQKVHLRFEIEPFKLDILAFL